MVGVKVRTIETGEQRTSPIVSVPILEEIIEQLDREVSFLTDQGKQELAVRIQEIAQEGNQLSPGGRFSRAFNPKKITVLISEWENEYVMYTRMQYPGDYSSLIMPPPVKADGIEFHPVFVINTKQLYIHFVR